MSSFFIRRLAMNFERKRIGTLVYSVLLLAMFLAASGCSKEAKLERHWKKGEQYFTENKPREALLEYKNVLKLNPKHTKAHYKLGLTYLRMGMIREAYAEISKTVELDPGMIDARNQLGQLYLLSGDRKKAREQAEAVLAKDARNSSAHLLLSNAYLTEKNLDQAIVESRKAVQGEQKMGAYLHTS
jgi:Tfp pilus assembly protein PilF